MTLYARDPDAVHGEAGSGDLRRWRRRRMLRAGFKRPVATELAADHRFDLHGALELIDRGCPPDLAARILAPIDGEGEAF
jgi:hypothetical protein